MCAPASLVLTETQEFFSLKSDRHMAIIAEHHIREVFGERVNVLKIEITPPNGDWCAPLPEWVYQIDQDILPDWHDPERDEERARAALQNWADAKLFTTGNHRVENQQAYAAGESMVTACDQSTVAAYDQSMVTAYDQSTVKACNQSTVTACNQSTVRAYDQSTVTACNQSAVRADDQSTVTAYDQSTVTACNQSTVTAYDQSTVRAYDQSTVRACNQSTVTACNQSTVTACNQSTVTAYNQSTVAANDQSSVIKYGSKPVELSDLAACVDRSLPDSVTVSAAGASFTGACR
jgi:hypothetical protein